MFVFAVKKTTYRLEA